MQNIPSPELSKALKEYEKNYARIAEDNLRQSSIIKDQAATIKKIEDELKHKNDRVKLLQNEVIQLKKQYYHSIENRQEHDLKENGEGQEDGKDKKKLLDIHLQDLKFSSDKWEHYFHQYEVALQSFRNKNNVRILEIGVQNGGSLQCWSNYFGANSEVVGIDIDPKTSFLEYEGAIKNYVGDATDDDWLKIFCGKEDDFDIIIDDGSHRNEDIIKTFVLLFKKLRPGGIYIGEDLHACYWKSHNGGIPSDSTVTSAITFFKEIIDDINSEHWISLCQYNTAEETPLLHQQTENDEQFRILLRTIESIKFTNSMVFIKKSDHAITELGKRVVVQAEALVDTRTLKLAEDQ